MLTKKSLTAAKSYVNQTDPRDVALASVIGTTDKGMQPGPFQLLPVLGWLRLDPQDKTLGISLSCLLLRVYDNRQMGTLGWNIPVNERTEDTACGLLTSMGWDGRIWPLDPGWPDASPEEAGIDKILLESKLFATFVFPPEPQGNRVLRVDVTRTSGDFPLSPEVTDGWVEPTEVMRSKFRRLIAEPGLFLK